MKILLTLLFAFAGFTSARAEISGPPYSLGHGFAMNFSKRLGEVEGRLDDIEHEMRSLPIMSDLDARGTHGFHSNFIPTSEENWFAIQWEKPRLIDGIGMIPTRIITQSGISSNYGLPARMRIIATGPDHDGPFVLAEIQNTRLDLRLGEPIFINLAKTRVTSLRFIPIDLPTLPGKSVRFFSLAELMVYQANENIAPIGKLTASYSIDTEAGWNIRYLTDGQSPLGPPELPIAGKSLGWHADVVGVDVPTWAIIDLGHPQEFDTIRLYAARGDAPIKGPGFGFPVRFRLEAGDGLEGHWKILWQTGDSDLDNPGYNTCTFRVEPSSARYVRLMVIKRHAPDSLTTPRVLLSEMEILKNGNSIALGAPVTTSDSRPSIKHDATRVWSSAGLTDGFTSTGKLIQEREWIASLSHRFDLLCEMKSLHAERERIVTLWQQAFVAVIFGVLSVVILSLLVWQIRTRLANRRTMNQLKRRISSDLHDEVGSNLATIALLAELAPAPENLDDINRLSRETSLALREIVEITLASKRARKPLLERLREIASLMLREHEWNFDGTISPEFGLEQRRHLVFFFKEALHNIIRHADASKVRILFEKIGPRYHLMVEDDGRGILASSPVVMGNLRTLHQRAESLGGALEVWSQPDLGTRLNLTFPVQPPKPK